MAATSFGGSQNLVATGDSHFRDLLWGKLTRIMIDALLPFLKYLPFAPPQLGQELADIIDKTVGQRREDQKEGKAPKRDLVKIILDIQDEEPETYTYKHVREEMILFM
jgi:hypothetical protein